MPSKEEIETIVDDFDRNFALAKAERDPRRTGCAICNSPNIRQINRLVVQRRVKDHQIGKQFGYVGPSVFYHRIHCLPKYTVLEPTEVERVHARRAIRFPETKLPVARKRWYLRELLFLRDELMQKTPVDHKELLRLAKEIDAANDALEKAKAQEGKKNKGPETESDDDLTAQQLGEMSKVRVA
jgi:hypothetical protein